VHGRVTRVRCRICPEQVRILRERIPEFVQLPNDRVTRNMRRQSRLNPEFAQEAFGAVGASETVQSAIGNTPEDLLRAEDDSKRWGIVEAELSALLSGVAAGNVVRRQRIAEVALQAYNVSTQVVKHEAHSGLLPHVERMKRLPKYGSRRSRPSRPDSGVK
jgi:hypothetical protein